MATTSRPYVLDTRERRVNITVTDGAPLLTPARTRLMDVLHLNIHYQLDPETAAVTSISVEAVGEPIGAWGARRRAKTGYLKRRIYPYDPAAVPAWLSDLVDLYHPDTKVGA